MNPPTPIETPAHDLAGTAKSIKDLDLLLRALLTSLPTAKPWQRQLRLHLVDADGLLQVLRMTISMDRSQPELLQAAKDLLAPLRAANVYVGAGRADAGTKQAVNLGYGLGQRIATGLAFHREPSSI